MTDENEIFEETTPEPEPSPEESDPGEETENIPEELPEESTEPEEPIPEEEAGTLEPEVPAPADIPVVVIDGDTGEWEEYGDEIPYRDSGTVVILQETPRPLLTTPFSDYTVTEGLLLLVLLYLLALSCVRMLKGGFPWLR